MIDAGSGYPPHWRGEAADANLATATAMQAPTERHLLRRQQYFSYILQESSTRPTSARCKSAWPARCLPAITSQLFSRDRARISRATTTKPWRTAPTRSPGLPGLGQRMPSRCRAWQRLAAELVLRSPAPQPSTELDAMVEELGDSTQMNVGSR